MFRRVDPIEISRSKVSTRSCFSTLRRIYGRWLSFPLTLSIQDSLFPEVHEKDGIDSHQPKDPTFHLPFLRPKAVKIAVADHSRKVPMSLAQLLARPLAPPPHNARCLFINLVLKAGAGTDPNQPQSVRTSDIRCSGPPQQLICHNSKLSSDDVQLPSCQHPLNCRSESVLGHHPRGCVSLRYVMAKE
jgi:hypothetical protein